ncbi:MAG: YhdP family protein [Thiohalomonadaceae bacterium]
MGLLRQLFRLLLITLVSLALFSAIAMTALRLAVGHVSEYRQEVSRLVGDYLGMPVQIAGIHSTMIGFKPALILEEITLLEQPTRQPLAEFSHLAITLDLPRSLLALRPMIALVLSGAEIHVQRQSDGSLVVQGLPRANERGLRAGSGAMLEWLMNTPQLHLQHGQLYWQDQPDGEYWHFQIEQLLIQNHAGQRRLKGRLLAPAVLGKQLDLAIELDGAPHKPDSWDAHFYLKLQQLQLSSRAGEYRYRGWQVEQGELDLELWGHWRDRQLALLEGSLALDGLQVSHARQGAQQLNRLASEFRYQQQGDESSLQLQQLQIRRADEASPPMRLGLRQQDGLFHAQLNRLELDQLRPWLPELAPWLSEAQQQWLNTAAPSGRLDELRLSFSRDALHAARAQLDAISVQATGAIPGIRGLSGQLAYTPQQLQLQLESSALEVNLPRLFRRPLALRHSQGQFQLARETDGWRLFGQDLRIHNQDIHFQGEFQALLDDPRNPLIALQGSFDQVMASQIHNYLPASIIPPATLAWLDQAFLTGQAEQGRLLLHGRARDFPFHQGQGHFETIFQARGLSLSYGKQWPVLHELEGTLQFRNAGMHIQAQHGRVFDAVIGQTRIDIDHLNRALLVIDGSASAGAESGLRFLRESPIARNLSILRELHAQGDTRLQLQLQLPLSKQLDSPQQILGQIQLNNGQMTLGSLPGFEQLEGQLHFDSHRLHATGIHARFLDQAVTVDVIHREQEGNETLLIAQGEIEADKLQAAFPWLDTLQGQSDWRAQLAIPHRADRHPHLHLSSDLQGLSSALPHPLQKTTTEALDLVFDVAFPRTSPAQYTLRLGDRLSAQWQEGTGSVLHFGPQQAPSPPQQEQLLISGELEGVRTAPWLALLAARNAQTNATGTPGVMPAIQVAMQKLQILAEDDQTDDTLQQDRIHRPYPAIIQADIAELEYHGMTLGHAQLALIPETRQMRIETLTLEQADFSLSGKGHWHLVNGTELALQLRSDNVGGMLERLGFTSLIRNGKGQFEASLRWPGSPAAFSLAQLDGQLSLRIDEGTLEEVRPGAGKMLGLLSLQALPRRLLLDFRDVAESGLHFKRIQGDLEIRQGHSYSQNFTINTHPALLHFSGRTGLVDRDFDQQMTMIPQVSDTVSVAGALTLGPQIGAVLLVLQGIFKRDIDAATMRRYQITGSWEQPELVWLNPSASHGEETKW